MYYNDQVLLYDPSDIIKNDHSLALDINHWDKKGYEKNFSTILKLM